MVLAEPSGDLIVGKNLSPALFGDSGCICDVIKVPMGNKDMGRMKFRGFGLCRRIRFQERVDEQMEFACVDTPGRMAMPCDPNAGTRLGFVRNAHDYAQ